MYAYTTNWWWETDTKRSMVENQIVLYTEWQQKPVLSITKRSKTHICKENDSKYDRIQGSLTRSKKQCFDSLYKNLWTPHSWLLPFSKLFFLKEVPTQNEEKLKVIVTMVLLLANKKFSLLIELNHTQGI